MRLQILLGITFINEELAKNIALSFANQPEGVHGFDNQNNDDRSREIIRTAIEFYQATFGKRKSEVALQEKEDGPLIGHEPVERPPARPANRLSACEFSVAAVYHCRKVQRPILRTIQALKPA
jgi:hypothetical protein